MPEEKSYKGDHYAYELACARYDQMTDYINGASGVEGCESSPCPGFPRKP